MTVKPILFATPMVKAILKGDKTETRRIIKPQPPNSPEGSLETTSYGVAFAEWRGMPAELSYRAPYCSGDVLYVRETWAEWVGGYVYKADDISAYPHSFVDRWHPSIHMPKEAARIFLCVTGVQAERLQEITEDGAQREGFYPGWTSRRGSTPALTARQGFMWMWQYLTHAGPYEHTWPANPWVWVTSFERCEKPEAWPCCE
ncbi:MAG: hypothetical protein Q4E45_02320 [Eubacteriales bacterium]|nr:hypothetical protein [Eubacteriales bacterium]